jgi:hypothetical protein
MRLLALIALLLVLLAAPHPVKANEKATWDGVAYLPRSISGTGGYEFLRYDLESRTWLTPLAGLPPGPGYFGGLEADASGLYALRGSQVFHVPFDGDAAELLFEGEPRAIGVDGDWLFVLERGRVRVLHKSDGGVVSERAVTLDTYGMAVAPAVKRVVLGSSSGVSALAYGPDGSLGDAFIRPRLDLRLSLAKLRTFPDGRRVLGETGHVYDAENLDYIASLPFEMTDSAFAEGLVVGVGPTDFEDAAIGFTDPGFTEVGRFRLTSQSQPTLFAYGAALFVVYPGSEGDPPVEVRERTELVLPSADRAIDPLGLSYEPGQVVVTRDEVAYIRADNPAYLNLFRWSVRKRTYLKSIGLREMPSEVIYDEEGDVLYVVYPSRRITRIVDPSGDDPVEAPFSAAPTAPEASAVVHGHLVLCSWASCYQFYVLDASGSMLAVHDAPFGRYADRMAASQAGDRVYFAGSSLAGIQLGERGEVRQTVLGPGTVSSTSALLRPGEQGLELFDGEAIRRGDTLEIEGRVSPVPVGDAAWLGSLLVTVGTWNHDTLLRSWRVPFASPEFETTISYRDGSFIRYPKHLVRSGDGLLLVLTRFLNGYPTAPLLVKIHPGPDLDGDGVPDESDLYPLDPSESADRDGDGYPDNTDAFPDDVTQHADRDGDHIPDPLDRYPDDPEVAVANVTFDLRVTARPWGRLGGSLSSYVHLFEDGGFLLCPAPDACLPGAWFPLPGRHLAIQLLPEVLEGLEGEIELALENGLSERLGRPVDLDLGFRGGRSRLVAVLSRNERTLRVKLEFPYEAVSSDLPKGMLRGVFRMRGKARTLRQ